MNPSLTPPAPASNNHHRSVSRELGVSFRVEGPACVDSEGTPTSLYRGPVRDACAGALSGTPSKQGLHEKRTLWRANGLTFLPKVETWFQREK